MGRQVTSNDRRIENVADAEARFLAGAFGGGKNVVLATELLFDWPLPERETTQTMKTSIRKNIPLLALGAAAVLMSACQQTATPPVVVNTPPAAEGSTMEKSATTSTTQTETPPVVNSDGSVAAGSKTTTTRDTTMEKKRP